MKANNTDEQNKIAAIVFLIVVVGLVIIFTLKPNNNQSQQATTSKAETVSSELSEEKKYSYVGSSDKTHEVFVRQDMKSGRYAALISPFLPRNDSDLVKVMNLLAVSTYNVSIENINPQIEEKNGVNVLNVAKENVKYYFLINKEDTGEINAITYWKE